MILRCLDLFCGAGGVAKGLQRAGFHVTGVDIKPQPRYCGDSFHQADAATVIARMDSLGYASVTGSHPQGGASATFIARDINPRHARVEAETWPLAVSRAAAIVAAARMADETREAA